MVFICEIAEDAVIFSGCEAKQEVFICKKCAIMEEELSDDAGNEYAAYSVNKDVELPVVPMLKEEIICSHYRKDLRKEVEFFCDGNIQEAQAVNSVIRALAMPDQIGHVKSLKEALEECKLIPQNAVDTNAKDDSNCSSSVHEEGGSISEKQLSTSNWSIDFPDDSSGHIGDADSDSAPAESELTVWNESKRRTLWQHLEAEEDEDEPPVAGGCRSPVLRRYMEAEENEDVDEDKARYKMQALKKQRSFSWWKKRELIASKWSAAAQQVCVLKKLLKLPSHKNRSANRLSGCDKETERQALPQAKQGQAAPFACCAWIAPELRGSRKNESELQQYLSSVW